MIRQESSNTDRYYLDNALDYAQRTVGADMSELRNLFLSMLPHGGSILDAGCGSGRDLKVFLERGFQAMGLDASTELIKIAKSYSGAQCQVGRIEDLADENRFDGIWACASLLHFPKSDIRHVLDRLHEALVPNGILFASVQEGLGEQTIPDGRFFSYYQLAEFIELLKAAAFSISESWITADTLSRTSGIRWINVLAKAVKET